MRRDRLSRLQGAVGLSVLAMVLMSALALGANRPVSWSLLSIGVALLFVLQIGLILANPIPHALRRAALPGLLFGAAALWGWVQSTPGMLSGFAHPVWALVPEAPPAISADPGQGRHAVMRLFCYATVFVILVRTCASAEPAARVLKAIAVFSSLLAAYGLYAFATGANPILDDLARRGMVQSSFVNRNSYATYAAFGVLANIAAYLHIAGSARSTLRNRLEAFFRRGWIYGLGVILCLGALSLTQSRAGGGAALIGLAVFLVAWRGGRQRWDPVMLGLIGGVVIFIGATSAAGLLERMIATDATDGRFTIYPAILAAILDRPFLGHGIGAFHDAFRPYIPLEGAMGEWIRAHNTYLELAFGLGLPAALALLMAQALIVWQIWRGTVQRRCNRVFSCFALGCAATAAVHSGADFSLQMPATAGLFSVILALGFAQSFPRREANQARDRRAAVDRPSVAGGDAGRVQQSDDRADRHFCGDRWADPAQLSAARGQTRIAEQVRRRATQAVSAVEKQCRPKVSTLTRSAGKTAT